MRSFEEIKKDLAAATSLNNATALVEIATELQGVNIPDAFAAAENALGTAARLHGDADRALHHYDLALDLYTELDDRKGIALVTGNKGNVFLNAGDLAQALELYRRSLAVHEDMGTQRGIALMAGNIGLVYMQTASYPEALEWYSRALTIMGETGDQAGIARTIGNMGIVYLKVGSYNEAREHLQQAIRLNEDLGDTTLVSIFTGALGGVYHHEGSFPEAEECYRRSLSLSKELGHRPPVMHQLSAIVSLFLDQGRDEEASIILDEQEALGLDHAFVANYYGNRATLAEHRGELQQARDLLQQGLAMAEQTGVRDTEMAMHMHLRTLAQQLNDFEGYIHHNTEYLRLTEEIRGKEATQRIAMMEAERKMEIERRERDKERALLYGALPETIAQRMLRGEDVSGDHFDEASVLFLDIAGFTRISDRIPPGHVVHLLKAIFKVCDDVCEQRGLTKIKTIGDSYMAVAGVPEPLEDQAHRAAHAAIDMLKGLNELELTMDPSLGDTSWTKDVGEIKVRIGLHCGPLVAGIVGDKRLQYDVWGDTVNVASRMESSGEPGRIQVSSAFADQLLLLRSVAEKEGTANSNSQQQLTERGTIEVKGKGTMTTYWLEGA